MTRNQIRDILDQLGISSRIDNEGDLNITLTADEEFGYNVDIWLIVTPDGKRLSFVGAANDYHPSGDLLYMANRSNSRRNFPTAVVRGKEIRFEYSFYISEEVSQEYITNCIRAVAASIWTGFRDFEKENLNS